MDWRSWQRYSYVRPERNFRNSLSESQMERDFDGSDVPEWTAKLIKKKKKVILYEAYRFFLDFGLQTAKYNRKGHLFRWGSNNCRYIWIKSLWVVVVKVYDHPVVGYDRYTRG